MRAVEKNLFCVSPLVPGSLLATFVFVFMLSLVCKSSTLSSSLLDFLMYLYLPISPFKRLPVILESKVKVKSLSHVRLFVTPWAVAYQASQSMGFSRQEYWSGLPFPSPGDLTDPGIESGFPTL